MHLLVDKLKWLYENARCYNKIYYHVTVQNGQIEQIEKQLFIHSHVRWLLIICHILWLYHVTCSSQKFLSCGGSWMLTYWCLSFPSIVLQSSCHWSLLKCPTISLELSCYLSPLTYPPCLAQQLQNNFFLCQFVDKFQEGKDTVQVQFVAMSFRLLISSVPVVWVAVKCCVKCCVMCCLSFSK